jgi:DNA-directed RNA polymerase subunit M/transcription elongation factor TFIIS
MAKKATKRTPPQKTCPECGEVMHARKGTCPKCGHSMASAGSTTTPVKKATRRGKTDSLAAALDFIESAGGITDAQAILKDEIGAAIRFVEAAGGLSQAQETIDRIAAMK